MLLVKPFLGCNLACKYCYEKNIRRKTRPRFDYDLEVVLKRMEEYKDLEIAFHGGEPLMMPKKDVEKILAKSFELKEKSALQTNGTLIDDDYILMFKKYKTGVGISYDGPGVLSEFRPGTADLDETIERLKKENISVSLIIVVSKANAGTDDRLKKLKEYLLKLNQMKISGRLNPCVGAPGYELEEKRLIEVYLDLAQFCLENNLRWSPFVDIFHGLQGKDRVCSFMGCDIFHTPSATVILKDGSLSNCMRTNDQRILLRHPVKYKTREEILSQIPQDFGGCQGCPYFSACFGGCPASAINDDWRNRTYLCPLWKALFQYFEKVLKFTEYPILSQARECQPPPEKTFKPGSGHQDGHEDAPHGDAPHSDWKNHADHADADHFEAERPQVSHQGVPVGSPHQDGHGDTPHGDWLNHQDGP